MFSDVDQVAQLADDIQELQADQEEVSDLLGNPLGTGIDDAELEAELAELGEEEEVEQPKIALPTAPVTIPAETLPQVPSHTPNQTAEQLDDAAALAELQAEMAK